MRKYLKYIALFASALMIFAAGMITEAIRSRSGLMVTVVLVNESTHNIESVVLTHEHGSLIVANIKAGAQRTIGFYSPGESSYKLQVHFQNGRTVAGGAGYVEAGYKITEVISDSNIKSDYQ